MLRLCRASLLAFAIFASSLMAGPVAADCCGPPPAPPNEFELGPGWTGSIVFEHMEMTDLLQGSQEVSPDQVLAERLKAGAARYSVPTEMYMDRATAQLRYKFDETHSLRMSVPWRFNQMDMRMATRMPASPAMGGHNGQMGGGHMGGGQGMGAPAMPAAPMLMSHTMDPVDGLGDILLTYNATFPVEQARIYLGAGLQLPSGQWTVRDARGQLVHNMMQPGSGALGVVGEAGADIALGEGSDFSLHPRIGLQWNATNPLGYQRGTRFDYELGSRYQIMPELGLSLDLVGFLAGEDSTNGTIDQPTGQVAFQRPEVSLVDNVANTGGSFLFLAPGIRVQPTEDIFLGFQYRLPIHQNVNGIQLGINSWYRGFMSARF